MEYEVIGERKQTKKHGLFSKALFKQSCKANGLMWLIITVAVCFMLACVMLISGTSGISDMAETIEDSVIEQTLSSTIKKTGIANYKYVYDNEVLFDETFAATFDELNTIENAGKLMAATTDEAKAQVLKETYITPAYTKATQAAGLNAMYADYSNSKDTYKVELDPDNVYNMTMAAINPNNQADSTYTANGVTIPEEYIKEFSSYMLADIAAWAKGAPTTTLSTYIATDAREEKLEGRAYTAISMCIAMGMTDEKFIQQQVENLKAYNITLEKYEAMGFTYDVIETTAYEAMLEIHEKYDYEVSKLSATDQTNDEKTDAIYWALYQDVAGSLLEALPDSISDAIEEIGSMDLYGLIVGSIFFKMAGLLLPIIYIIMVSNSLIAGQVDSGSMAYVISTSTKREEVTFTQGLFLVGSLLAMFVCTTITAVVCFAIADVQTDLTYGKLILINLSAFVVMFAISGINYLASCWFDRSKYSMSIGGGISIFFLVATMLGLFGSHVIPSVIRISALNYFNYVSIISLFDVVSILDGSLGTWAYKLVILIVIGVIGYVVGAIKFKKKDLPL